MSLELSDQDEENALSEMSNNYGEMQEECDVLIEQVNRLVEENEKLQGTVKVLDNKVSITEASIEELEGVNGKLLYEVENLEASKDEAFVSSEKALVISNADREINEERTGDNQFLTDEVMKFMPFSNS